MAKPKYLNQARHLIAEYREAMIGENQFRYQLREFSRNMANTEGSQQLKDFGTQGQSIMQKAEEISRQDLPESDDIDILAEQLEQLDTAVTGTQEQNGNLSRFKTQWDQYDFNAYGNVAYSGYGYDEDPLPEDEPDNRTDEQKYQDFIDRHTEKTDDDDEALKRLALGMTAVMKRQSGEPFDDTQIFRDAEKLQKSKPFQDAFEQRSEDLDDFLGIDNALAKDYLETKNFTEATQKMSEFMKRNDAQEGIEEEPKPEVSEVIEENEVEPQPEEPEDFSLYFRNKTPESMVSRRALMQEVRDTNWKVKAVTEMSAYLLGPDTARRRLMDEVQFGQALGLMQQINGQSYRLQSSIDKVEDITARTHQFPETGDLTATEKTGTLDVYLLRMIDHLDLPEGVDKKRKKQELIDRIKHRGPDYREYYELSCKIPEDGKPLKERDANVYEYVASDQDFALMAAFKKCADGHGRDKVPSAAAFKAEVARTKEDPLTRVIMGNKGTVEKLRRGDADGVAAAIKTVNKNQTFQNQNEAEQAKQHAKQVFNAMERMQGRDTQSPEWVALKAAVKAYAENEEDGKDAERAANVLVNVEKFTKKKKNFQKDPNRQECVNLALDALKTCVPNAQTNPVSKPLVDRFTEVRGRNRPLDLSKHGYGSEREKKLYPTYQDVWSELERKAVIEDDRIRTYQLDLAMNNLDDPGIVKLHFRGRQALLNGLFPGASANPEWRMMPAMQEKYSNAVKVAGNAYLANILNDPNNPMREAAAEFTGLLASEPELLRGFNKMTSIPNNQEACDKLLADYKKAMETGKGEDLKKVSDALVQKKEPEKGPVIGM